MITLVSELDSQIFDAYQRLKKARGENDFVGMVEWTSRIDHLLDRRGPSGNTDNYPPPVLGDCPGPRNTAA